MMVQPLQFSTVSPPPAPAPARARRRSRPSHHPLWKPGQRLPKPPPPPLPALKYSLAHRKGAARFTAAVITFTRPERGVQHLEVACPTCREKVTVLVRSHTAVTLERWKRVAYIVLAAGVLFAFTALIPWERLSSGSETCVSLFALLAFGAIGLYNGAQAIAPEASLLVDLPRKPFVDMFPSLSSSNRHTVLKKNP